jgi:SAM-dependent methyltransferase
VSASPPSRDLDHEHQDNAQRKYSYDFDGVLRRFMMRSFLPGLPRGRALELGSNRGDFTEIIFPHFPDLTVVEGAAELAAATQARLGPRVQVVHSTFERFAPEKLFEAIFLVHTLEHSDDPVGLLARIGRWLAPGGRLVVAVPNANAPSRQIAVKMGLIGYNAAVTEGERQHGHRVTYSFDTLERDVRSAGLAVEQRGGVFFKALANFQLDQAMASGLINEAYLEGCYQLGMQYPELCASIFLVCGRGDTGR